MTTKVISTTSFGLDTVNVSLLRSDDGSSWKTQPLVITPRWETSLTFLCSFLKGNRKWVDEMILRYGAVLCRGFEVTSACDFEQAVMSYQPELSSTYRGTSPRAAIPGTKKVFSAAEVPTNYPIAQHCEMSFLPAPPRQLYFGCLKESATTGGETALCDFKKVYHDISPELRQKLLTKKLLYTRTQRRVGARFTHDVSDMKGWPEIFGTSSKDEVERLCAAEGDSVSWTGPNKDIFVSKMISEPFQLHPQTNEPVWYNHIQVFHWTTFPAELYLAFKRTYDIRYLLHCVIVSIVSLIKYVILGHKMSLDASFGDGTPISISEMNEIRSCIHKNIVFNRWQRGDILLIDNFGTSHGRQPTFDKGRKIIVSWSESFVKENKLTSGEIPLSLKNSTNGNTPTTSAPFKEDISNPQEHSLKGPDIHELKGLSGQGHKYNHSPSLVSDDKFWQKGKRE